jgi:pyrroloquinoline quinone biosynthesis protein B
MAAKAIVLGSAAGGGFPQWNCRCANCALAWAGDPRARWRTQSSLALTADREVVLIDASPDLPQQLRSMPPLWPTGTRQSPIATVFLTSAEIDHVAGLVSLRERHAFEVIAFEPVIAAVGNIALFRPLGARWRAMRPGEETSCAGLALSLLPVAGKSPLYLEEAGDALDSEAGEAAALVVRGEGATLLYVPGCAALTPALRGVAESADVVLFDGTLFDDEEMLRAGLGRKTGRRMGHLPMTGRGGSRDWLAALPARRKIYTHLNNSNPVLIEGSPERRLVEEAGVEVAFDGLEIAL